MSDFLPPGMVPFAAVLARLAQAWTPEAWNAAPARETAVLLGEDLHTFQRGQALRTGSVADVTYARLRPMLADGRLSVMLRAETAAPHVIPPQAWLGRSADSLPALLAEHVGFTLAGGVIERGTVLVAEDALVALIEGRPMPAPAASHVEPQPAPEPPKRGNPGGRPPRHDVALFLGIAARIHYDKAPDTPAQLRRLALDAYSATLPAGENPPSDEGWAKPLIRTFLEGYEVGGRRSG